MKNIFKSFFVIAAAALTLVGCQKKEIGQSQNEGEYVYTFTIDDETARQLIKEKMSVPFK